MLLVLCSVLMSYLNQLLFVGGLTRTSATNLFYEIIFEDPEKATGQWRTTNTYVGDARAGVNKVMEFVCENNRDYIPLFGPQGPPPPGAGGRGGRGQ